MCTACMSCGAAEVREHCQALKQLNVSVECCFGVYTQSTCMHCNFDVSYAHSVVEAILYEMTDAIAVTLGHIST